jgi:uncharacterized protein YbjT (DUF2867 family)
MHARSSNPSSRSCCSAPTVNEVVAITRTPETVSRPAEGRFGGYDRPESLAGAYAGLDRLLIIPALDADKFEVPEERIKEIRAVLTVVDARVVFGSGQYVGLAPELAPAIPEWAPAKYVGGYYNTK